MSWGDSILRLYAMQEKNYNFMLNLHEQPQVENNPSKNNSKKYKRFCLDPIFARLSSVKISLLSLIKCVLKK